LNNSKTRNSSIFHLGHSEADFLQASITGCPASSVIVLYVLIEVKGAVEYVIEDRC